MMHQSWSRKKNKGVALITALLVVSLATIMAISLMSRQYIDIRRAGNMMQSDQAYLDAIAAETFVGQLLANLRSQGQSKFDDIDLFNLALIQLSGDMTNEVRQVSVQAIYPEARFNVNNLIRDDGKVDTKQEGVYRRLLASVVAELEGSSADVDSLISSLLDWLDKDEEARIDGAEDSVYEGKTPPYKAANRMLTSISEMRLVEGYTAELLDGIPANEEQEIEAINGLLSYVSALPGNKTTINVNAVSDLKVISALSVNLDLSMAEELFDASPYEQVTEFSAHETLNSIREGDSARWTELKSDMTSYQNNLTVQSEYFLIKSHVTVGKTRVSLNSLVFINKDGTKFDVISRAIGTDGI